MMIRMTLVGFLLVGLLAVPVAAQRTGGDNCDDPLEVYLDWNNLPFQLLGETTCGRSNDYNSTCLGNYDEGEDFVLKFDLPVFMSLMITMDPNGTSFTGVMVFQHCYPNDTCIAYSTESGIATHQIDLPFLEPGSYYVMVDNWPSPDCISSFDLQIEEVFFDNFGQNCGIPISLELSPQNMPMLIEGQSTCGLVDEYDNTCLGDYDGGEDMIFEIHVTTENVVNIGLDPHSTTWTAFVLDDECPPAANDCIAMSTSSAAQYHEVTNIALSPGYYYLMVDTWPQPDCIPEFDLHINDPFGHQMGDDCELPLQVNVPGDLPITFEHEYTTGRQNDYNNTCLGAYDEDEDLIYEVDVTVPTCVNITLDPAGRAGTGMAISETCPPGTECLAMSTNDAATPHSLQNVALDVGVYYLIVDCTSGTELFDDFSVSFETCPQAPENDKCENAIAIGNVTNMAFSTENATLDGPAECQSAPNIWYCYTAQNTGVAEFSLCGSSYDTYIAVYDGCDCGALGTPLGCNDDYCDLQSLAFVEVASGQQYLIEVGGSGGATGSGVLTAYIPPPECGNVNGDGVANITDAVSLIQWIFAEGAEPFPMGAGDANCDVLVNVTDAVCIIQWIFAGGPPPCDIDDDGTPDCYY